MYSNLNQLEFDFSDCYNSNFPPLDLSKYKKDRNYEFYVAQEEYRATESKKAWDTMYYYIYNVCLSTAKKLIKGLKVPDLEGKALNACLTVMEKYKKDKYFRALKIENVVYHPVNEEIHNRNLQIDERTYNIDDVINEDSIERFI